MRPNYYWSTIVLLLYFNYLVMGQSTALPKEVINHVKSTLLPLLGFKDRPTFKTDNIEIPTEMRRIYEKQTGFHLDTASIPLPGIYAQSANTVRSFTHIESNIGFKKNRDKHIFRLKFDITSLPETEILKAAQLSFSLISKVKNRANILILDIIQPKIAGKSDLITNVIDSKTVTKEAYNDNLKVDVILAVQRWLKQPSANYGLLVVVTSKATEEEEEEEEEEWLMKQSVLFVYTDDGRNKQNVKEIRRKRENNRYNYKQYRQCRRHSMNVNFTEIGWNDWIISPLNVNLYYCGGSCGYPIPDYLNPTNHAIIQSIFHMFNPTSVPTSCCIPTKLNSLSIIYKVDEHSHVMKNYKDMIVASCGCQ